MVFMIRYYANEEEENGEIIDMKCPIYVDLDMKLDVLQVKYIIGEMEKMRAIVKHIVSDQCGSNVGFYNQLGVSPSKPYIMSPTVEDRKIYVLNDITHIAKNLCWAIMDRAALMRSGYFISKEDWEDLLKKTQSEVSRGYKLTQFDLDCRGSSRMDAAPFYRIFSTTTVALFRLHFGDDPQKLAVADFIEMTLNAVHVLQSRVIEDEKIPLKSAYRFHLQEQEKATDLFVAEVKGLKFYTKGCMTFQI